MTSSPSPDTESEEEKDQIIVYRYGRLRSTEGLPIGKLPETLIEQLRLAHDLRNDLVRIDLEADEAMKALWSSQSTIAEVEAEIERLTDRADTLAKQSAKERAAQRKKGPTASTAELRAVQRELRGFRAKRRELIRDAKRALQPQIDAINDGVKAAYKALYADYSQTRSLYWATYNDVLKHHKTAVQRIKELRAENRPASLRFHRWEAEGSLAVQLQRQTGVQPRTPATIADTRYGKWRNVLSLPWVNPATFDSLSRSEQRQQGRGTLRLYLGNERHHELSIIVDRMLPPEADITGARLVVTRRASHRKTELHVTAKLPPVRPTTRTGPVVAVDFGWRRDEGGQIRIATWRSTAPLAVPADLTDVVTSVGVFGTIVLPARLIRRSRAHDGIRSDRDQALDKMKARLVAWLEDHPQPELKNVQNWRSPARFAVLAAQWRENPPDPDIAAELEAWRRADKLLWEHEAHGRAGAIDARDDVYRRVAAWLTRSAIRVVVSDLALSQMARQPRSDADSTVPSIVTDRASSQRHLAAPGRLRQLLVTAAKSRGVTIDVQPHKGITRTHYRCGHVNPADERYAASRIVTCDGCGSSFDQDASATLNLLVASGDVPPPDHSSAR